MKRILLVEDDAHLAEGLQYNLARAGFEVRVASDGDEGLRRALGEAPDLVVLDLMLPGRSGFDVLAALVAERVPFPVFVLSARAEEADKLRGFDLGAIDYLTKPFSVGELIARIRVRLRERPDVHCLALGALRVDLVRMRIEGGGVPVHLTPTEVALLRVLAREPGKPVSRAALLRSVWNLGAAATRTLDAHVARLRKKIERDPAVPRHLETVRGVGYRLVLGTER